MKKTERKITKADIAVITILVLITVVSFVCLLFPRERGDRFTVTVSGYSVTYPLGDYRTFDIESCGYSLTVSVTADGVSVTSSSCPDHICVSTGTISRPGQSIVCIPARVVIDIPKSGNGGENGEDFIVG